MTGLNPTDPATSYRRYWIRAAGAALLLAGLGVAGWWWFRPPAATPPPLPSGILDAEVQQAIQDARQRVLEAPRSATAWGRLGLVLLAHQFDREADFSFTQAAQLDPADPRWPYARGMIALRFYPDNAVALLRQAAAAGDSRPKYRFATRMLLAETLLERGNLAEADDLFSEEEQRQPKNPRVALGLALGAALRGDDAAANKYLMVARQSPWARKKATAQLAALARAHGDKTAAVAYENEVMGVPEDPPWPDPVADEIYQTRVGWSIRAEELAGLEDNKRYREAAEIHLKQIEEHPTAEAYVRAGTHLARLGDYQRALPLLHKAVLLEPDNANAYAVLAAALFARAKKEGQALPNSAEARQWFGEVVGHAQRATELRPDLANAYLHWGLALTQLGKPDEAVVPLRKGVACQPADLELQLSLGEALLEARQYQEAETHLENARLLAPNDPRAARALERLRQKNKN
jgi:Flp pilus assembly protein TadD